MAPDFYQICKKKYLQAQKTRSTIYKFKEWNPVIRNSQKYMDKKWEQDKSPPGQKKCLNKQLTNKTIENF